MRDVNLTYLAADNPTTAMRSCLAGVGRALGEYCKGRQQILFQSKIIHGGWVEALMRRCVDFLGPCSLDQVGGRLRGDDQKKCIFCSFFCLLLFETVLKYPHVCRQVNVNRQ